ncbi:unnamed protein product [Auanema sp. JU1783]|nr:unnamed protein product [Auanema sp. JU1783]
MVVNVPDELGGTKKLNDNYEIPMIGLGISRITDQNSLNDAIEAALRSGYRLFDTAHIYANESQLGNALQLNLTKFGLTRSDVFITTKVPIVDENTSDWVKTHLRESLTKLQTDYLDLVLVHYPRDRFTGSDGNRELNQTGRRLVWEELEEAQARGLIRSIGVSNYTIYHLEEMDSYAKVKPVLNQIEFHPYLTIDQIRSYCATKNVFVQAFSSLCWANQDILNEPVVQLLAAKYSVSPQIILYTFALNTGVGIIPKSATPSRIEDNIKKTAAIRLEKTDIFLLMQLDQNKAFCPGCQCWRVL